jgi:hypothetical protein
MNRTESQKYIDRHTAREAITLACSNIKRLCTEPEKQKKLSGVIESLEHVRDSLIGS